MKPKRASTLHIKLQCAKLYEENFHKLHSNVYCIIYILYSDSFFLTPGSFYFEAVRKAESFFKYNYTSTQLYFVSRNHYYFRITLGVIVHYNQFQFDYYKIYGVVMIFTVRSGRFIAFYIIFPELRYRKGG